MSTFSYSNFCKAIRFTFKGRDPRRVFWSFAGFSTIYLICLLMPLPFFGDLLPKPILSIYFVVLGVCYFATLIVGTMSAVRRLHDTGKSGFWVLAYVIVSFVATLFGKVDTQFSLVLALVNFAFWVVMIVFLTQKSDPVSNKYGEPVDSIDR